MSKKTTGYVGSQVYDPEGGGVALVVQVTVPNIRKPLYECLRDIYPIKQRNGTAFITHSDHQHGETVFTVLIGAAKQQTGSDVVRTVARACEVPEDTITYTTTGGILCNATANHKGSPRAGTKKRKFQKPSPIHR